MKEYNDIPVVYCERCLSLAIKSLEEEDPDQDYCEVCGHTKMKIGHIDQWLEEINKEKE